MIYLTNKNIKVLGYQKILMVTDTKIIFQIFQKKVLISGANLAIDYFENDEFSIVGDILKIEYLC